MRKRVLKNIFLTHRLLWIVSADGSKDKFVHFMLYTQLSEWNDNERNEEERNVNVLCTTTTTHLISSDYIDECDKL